MSKYENGKKRRNKLKQYLRQCFFFSFPFFFFEGEGRLQLPCQGGSFPICFCFFFYLKENYITMSLFS